MKLRAILAALLLSISATSAVHAAGSAINEDLTQLISITDDLINLGKKEDAEGFKKLANSAMDITSVNRNNSMVLSRVGTKLNSAKRAVNKGDFAKSIEDIQQAKALMLQKRDLTWDGGSWTTGVTASYRFQRSDKRTARIMFAMDDSGLFVINFFWASGRSKNLYHSQLQDSIMNNNATETAPTGDIFSSGFLMGNVGAPFIIGLAVGYFAKKMLYTALFLGGAITVLMFFGENYGLFTITDEELKNAANTASSAAKDTGNFLMNRLSTITTRGVSGAAGFLAGFKIG